MEKNYKEEKLQAQNVIRETILSKISEWYLDWALDSQLGAYRVEKARKYLASLFDKDFDLKNALDTCVQLKLYKKRNIKEDNKMIIDIENFNLSEDQDSLDYYTSLKLLFSYDHLKNHWDWISAPTLNRAKKNQEIPLSKGEDYHTTLFQILKDRKSTAKKNIKTLNQ